MKLLVLLSTIPTFSEISTKKNSTINRKYKKYYLPLMLQSSVPGWYVAEDMVFQRIQSYGRRTSKQT
jgi:hypothetical protein